MIPQMMSLRLAFLSIVHSSENQPRRGLLRSFGGRVLLGEGMVTRTRTGSSTIPRAATTRTQTCTHIWQCTDDETCEGAEEFDGNLPTTGVEKISNDMDTAVTIELKISPDQDFPWETLWQKMSQKAGEVDIVVIALQFDGSDQNTAWIGYHKEKLEEKLPMTPIASRIAANAALFVFVKRGSDLTIGVNDQYSCESGKKIAVHISLTKRIRGTKDHPIAVAATGRNMQLHWLSVNLDGENNRNECITQLTHNAKNGSHYNPENSSIEILGFYPKSTTSVRRLGAVRPFRTRRHLAALELRSLRRRLQGARKTQPVCMDESEVKKQTAILIRENAVNVEFSRWMSSEGMLMEGTDVENKPPTSFTYPGGVIRKQQYSDSMERCFYDPDREIDMPSRVWVIPPTNEQVYSVVTKFQEPIAMDQHQSSRHGLVLPTITTFSIFEYQTGRPDDQTLLIRGDDFRGDDRAVWVELSKGYWTIEGITYKNRKPVCDEGLENETDRNNFGIVVCTKYNAQFYKVELDHTTSHKKFGVSRVKCNGHESDLKDCVSEAASPETCNPSTGRAVKVRCAWVVEADYDFRNPALDQDFLEMPASSGTPHGGARQTATGTASKRGHLDLPVIDLQKLATHALNYFNQMLGPIIVQQPRVEA